MKPNQCFSPATTQPLPPPPPAVPAAPRAAAAPSAAARAIAPGKLRKHEQFRKTFRWGLALSGMPPHARLLGHDLLWRASHVDGKIAANQQPTVRRLAEATGLTEGQVGVALEVLYERGWLTYRTVQAGPRTGQNLMDLAIPTVYLERGRAERAARIQRQAEARAATGTESP